MVRVTNKRPFVWSEIAINTPLVGHQLSPLIVKFFHLFDIFYREKRVSVAQSVAF
jgi:hypothetical protein